MQTGKEDWWVYPGLECYTVSTTQREKDKGLECPCKGNDFNNEQQTDSKLDKEENTNRRGLIFIQTTGYYSFSVLPPHFAFWPEKSPLVLTRLFNPIVSAPSALSFFSSPNNYNIISLTIISSALSWLIPVITSPSLYPPTPKFRPPYLMTLVMTYLP